METYYTVGLLLMHSPPYWQLLCEQRHEMHKVQKAISAAISFIYMFYIEIVDFLLGIYLRSLKTFCRILKYR